MIIQDRKIARICIFPCSLNLYQGQGLYIEKNKRLYIQKIILIPLSTDSSSISGTDDRSASLYLDFSIEFGG